MNRTFRAILAVFFVLIITFGGITIFQEIGRGVKADVTEQGLYTLSDGTLAILDKLQQPVTVDLYYSKTAALKATDRIKFFNNYFEFVRSLLEEYAANSGGMVKLNVIDPRPYSDEEVEAIRYGLRRFNITEDESFFFGLVLKTQFGVVKSIPFFSPERQNFVEYDISYLIDTALTREKSRIGVISSLDILGDDVSGYMAQMMRMQGQQPKPAWAIIDALREQYEVSEVPADTEKIEDVDILLIIHPKDLSDKTLFAIDQFVLNGGRTIVFLDPHCLSDPPPQQQQMMMGGHEQSSNLDRLLNTWGVDMPEMTFAGDRLLAMEAPLRPNARPQKVIGFLGLNSEEGCFNEDRVMTADLNMVTVLFAGVLKETENKSEDVTVTPLVTTTARGNEWTVENPFELRRMDPEAFMRRFVDGTEPVNLGCLITGKLSSAFPGGIEVAVEKDDEDNGDSEEEKADEPETTRLTGLDKAQVDCAVAVFTDVDFMSDMLAFRRTMFGDMAMGDNSAMLVNTIEDLSGSSELISIRSRGNFQRPFEIVDRIEAEAEEATADEEAKIQAEIEGFENQLQEILASSQGKEQELIGSSILEKKKELEYKIRQAQKQLREVKMQRREKIESLGNTLRNVNMLAAPAIILVIAIVLGVYRSMRKRHYTVETSQA